MTRQFVVPMPSSPDVTIPSSSPDLVERRHSEERRCSPERRQHERRRGFDLRRELGRGPVIECRTGTDRRARHDRRVNRTRRQPPAVSYVSAWQLVTPIAVGDVTRRPQPQQSNLRCPWACLTAPRPITSGAGALPIRRRWRQMMVLGWWPLSTPAAGWRALLGRGCGRQAGGGPDAEGMVEDTPRPPSALDGAPITGAQALPVDATGQPVHTSFRRRFSSSLSRDSLPLPGRALPGQGGAGR